MEWEGRVSAWWVRRLYRAARPRDTRSSARRRRMALMRWAKLSLVLGPSILCGTGLDQFITAQVRGPVYTTVQKYL
jgi:hypothetical protein